MTRAKNHNKAETIILPIHDPFGLDNISLNGDLPSLEQEAEIVLQQWRNENGKNNMEPFDESTDPKTRKD